jgi:hypothetical protein
LTFHQWATYSRVSCNSAPALVSKEPVMAALRRTSSPGASFAKSGGNEFVHLSMLAQARDHPVESATMC